MVRKQRTSICTADVIRIAAIAGVTVYTATITLTPEFAAPATATVTIIPAGMEKKWEYLAVNQ